MDNILNTFIEWALWILPFALIWGIIMWLRQRRHNKELDEKLLWKGKASKHALRRYACPSCWFKNYEDSYNCKNCKEKMWKNKADWEKHFNQLNK